MRGVFVRVSERWGIAVQLYKGRDGQCRRYLSSSCVRHAEGETLTGKRLPNVLFFGSDRFSTRVLDRLYRHSVSGRRVGEKGVDAGGVEGEEGRLIAGCIEVVCPPVKDLRGGRGKKQKRILPIEEYCAEHGIPIHPLEVQKESGKVNVTPPLHTSRGDGEVFHLAAVVSFGYLIPGRVIDMFEANKTLFPWKLLEEGNENLVKGMVNVHPSLIPRYRGSSPIQYAILNGDSCTGVTVMGLSRGKFDYGAVLRQILWCDEEKQRISLCNEIATSDDNSAVEGMDQALQRVDSFTFPRLVDELSIVGGRLLHEHIALCVYGEGEEKGKKRELGPVDGVAGIEASLAPKISNADGYLDFENDSSSGIHRRVRALSSQISMFVNVVDETKKEGAGGRAGNSKKTFMIHKLVPQSQTYKDPLPASLIECLQVAQGGDSAGDTASSGASAVVASLRGGSVLYDKPSDQLFVKCGGDGGWVGIRQLQMDTRDKVLGPRNFANIFGLWKAQRREGRGVVRMCRLQ
eukprot:Nk52_evm28s272 gene=Nk52_evmTU28s272